MKIVEFIPQLGTGGAERFTIDLCNELVKGNEVYLLVSHDLKKFGFYTKEISDKVHVISFKKRNGFDIFLFFKVFKTIRKIKPDIIHTHLMSIVYISLTCVLFRKPKYFHTLHNDAVVESDGFIGAFFRRFLFKTRLCKPVTISNESLRSFVNFYHMNAPIIYNGRDIPKNLIISENVKKEIASYKVTEKTKIIVQLAHVGYQKRQDVMARVIDRLYKEGYDVSVLMIGTHDEENMVNSIKALENPRIHLLGVRSNPLEYLKLADGFGLCSSYEGLPISLIEAIGVGLIPICTPVGGIVDIIKDGYSGFLSDSIEEYDYYKAMKKFLSLSEQEIYNIRMNVSKQYEKLTMSECASKYISLFKK